MEEELYGTTRCNQRNDSEKEALFADAYIKQWDAIEAQKTQAKAGRHAVKQQ